MYDFIFKYEILSFNLHFINNYNYIKEMKKSFYKAFFLGILATATIACSSNDDSKDDEGNNNGGGGEVKYAHKVLLEDITGTWCSACPVGSKAIAQAKTNEANGNKIIATAIHIGQSSYPDPMQISAGVSLYRDFFGPSYGEGNTFYFPTIVINRAEQKWTQQGITQFFNAINKEGSSVGIKISSELTNTGGSITANFKFSQGYENLKYTIYVIEHDVKTNSAQQGTSEGKNYVHHDVLRAVSGTHTGNTLGSVKANEEVTKTGQSVNFTLFNNDLSKVDVVVFVTDNEGKILNVQKAKANQSIDYEKN